MEQQVKFDNLCSHYKDTYELHKEDVKHRDKLFYSLLIVLGLFTIQSLSPEIVAEVMQDKAGESVAAIIVNDINLISTLLWFALFGLSSRYFQINIRIERQYDYIHSLESGLNSFYPCSKAFTREGKSYLNKYPLFLNWMSILYTIVFPMLILFVVSIQILDEIKSDNENLVLDSMCCLVIYISVILYLLMIHGKTKFFKWLLRKNYR
ncbi:MAG: hypothetical protein KAI72_08045 [Candidatus Pacebacteria bacterium]|nr:hypothetical protein [Candidatus Paceibacterota bacterium]